MKTNHNLQTLDNSGVKEVKINRLNMSFWHFIPYQQSLTHNLCTAPVCKFLIGVTIKVEK